MEGRQFIMIHTERKRGKERRRCFKKILAAQMLAVCAMAAVPALPAYASASDGSGSSFQKMPPSESYYRYQWGIKNNGNITETQLTFKEHVREAGPGADPSAGRTYDVERKIISRGIAGMDINVEPAWDYYTASSQRRQVTVALIDTGVDFGHFDIKDAIWVNEDEVPGDGIDNDGNGYVDDIHGWNFYWNSPQTYIGAEDAHGTHAVGTIAARWDGRGITGIADSDYVKIMVLKVMGTAQGLGTSASLNAAIRYAEANGADICNLSLGSYQYDAVTEELIRNSRMLFVVSAGNGDARGIGYSIDTSPVYPAALPDDNIIAVANMMFDGSLEESSNFGSASVDIAAPGSYILSTQPYGDYNYMTGTSMAAPMVTGVAALVYSCRTDLSVAQVRTAILESARKQEWLAGKVSTGGILDAYGTITYGLNGAGAGNASSETEQTDATQTVPPDMIQYGPGYAVQQ